MAVFKLIFRILRWIFGNPKRFPRNKFYKQLALQKPHLVDYKKAKVSYIKDGDGVVVVTAEGEELEIRLHAVDSPEHGQPWGDTSKIALNRMLEGETVDLEIYCTDQHGRTVAAVFIRHGHKVININEEMVKCGHAWVDPRFKWELTPKRREKLEQLERWAKNKPVGLWKLENPVPPWQWRKTKSTHAMRSRRLH